MCDKGFSLDVMISFPPMPEVADFARAVPELQIILNHIGALNRVGLYANPGGRGARRMARRDHCGSGLSPELGGMGMPRMGFNWHTRAVPIARRNWPQTWRHGCSTVLSSSVRIGVCSKQTSAGQSLLFL